jgi:hypothetical protein
MFGLKSADRSADRSADTDLRTQICGQIFGQQNLRAKSEGKSEGRSADRSADSLPSPFWTSVIIHPVCLTGPLSLLAPSGPQLLYLSAPSGLLSLLFLLRSQYLLGRDLHLASFPSFLAPSGPLLLYFLSPFWTPLVII